MTGCFSLRDFAVTVCPMQRAGAIIPIFLGVVSLEGCQIEVISLPLLPDKSTIARQDHHHHDITAIVCGGCMAVWLNVTVITTCVGQRNTSHYIVPPQLLLLFYVWVKNPHLFKCTAIFGSI